MEKYFLSLFKNSNLVDIKLEREGPTWFNSHSSEDFIGKRLDWNLIHASLLSLMGGVKPKVHEYVISDHWPITVECVF